MHLDYTYIDDYEQFTERVKRFEKVILQDGIDIGMEKGIDIGMEKGIDIGMEKGIFESAKNGIAAGLSNEIISKMTKLSAEQIEALRNASH